MNSNNVFSFPLAVSPTPPASTAKLICCYAAGGTVRVADIADTPVGSFLQDYAAGFAADFAVNKAYVSQELTVGDGTAIAFGDPVKRMNGGLIQAQGGTGVIYGIALQPSTATGSIIEVHVL